jgi:hypothetical protein
MAVITAWRKIIDKSRQMLTIGGKELHRTNNGVKVGEASQHAR